MNIKIKIKIKIKGKGTGKGTGKGKGRGKGRGRGKGTGKGTGKGRGKGINYARSLLNGIPFEFTPILYGNHWVNPRIAVFSHQTIAAKRDSFEKAIFPDGIKHVL
jgi:hypothetical protein